ncbi:MAG: addiction module protein [Deltaproteobacteria bacterium]|nr:addiction module protein [Deltaproteobacteria bacterium]
MASILELEVEERLRLVHEIWDSIAEHPDAIPLTDGERAELERRLETYQRDPHSGSSWDEVKARIKRGR